LGVAWGRELSGVFVALVTALLAGAVLAAVHHAEVVAHRVGEPYGSLVLAVAVTVIEVALIVTLMIGGKGETATLARDTVFAAVMITCNGIVGLSILVAAFRRPVVAFNAEGSGAAFATVTTLATLGMVVPNFTTSTPGPQFSPPQLVFAAVTSLVLYGLFVALQAGRHRDYFLSVSASGTVVADDTHADPPPTQTALLSLLLLLVALVAVVGNAKLVSPTIERAVATAGLPASVVGVIIALLVLLPETLAAARAATANQPQPGLWLRNGEYRLDHSHDRDCIDLAARAVASGPRCRAHRSVRAHVHRHYPHSGAGARHPAAGGRPPRVAQRVPVPVLHALE
jgi:Ca2+:H+ antiporter